MLQGFFYEAKEKKLFFSPELGLSDELALNQHLHSINSPAPLCFENLNLFLLPNLFSKIIFDVTMLTDDEVDGQLASCGNTNRCIPLPLSAGLLCSIYAFEQCSKKLRTYYAQYYAHNQLASYCSYAVVHIHTILLILMISLA